MPQWLSPDTFEFFARYLLAGYVVIFVRSAFVLGLRPKPTELLIEAVILSLVVQLLLIPVEGLHDWLKASLPDWLATPSKTATMAVRVLAIPVLLGVVLGYFLQSGFRSGMLKRLSLPVIHPVRRAHDFAFGHDREAGLVEITFEDGTKVGGWFGENSLASTDDDRSDIYLERAYIIEDGNWKEAGEPRAILVRLKNVRTIEFLLPKEERDD